MTENEMPDPPEDAPFPDNEVEEVLRERTEDTRGYRPDDEEIAAIHREQGSPDQ